MNAEIGDTVKLKPPYGSNHHAPFCNSNMLTVFEINEMKKGDKFLRDGKETLCLFDTTIIGIETTQGEKAYYNHEWIEKVKPN